MGVSKTKTNIRIILAKTKLRDKALIFNNKAKLITTKQIKAYLFQILKILKTTMKMMQRIFIALIELIRAKLNNRDKFRN